ncbi:Detected protein of unknown function [Hibiscus syriacus]|uniref:Bromo domain-containing protein n=1 Tax=Hibiscus syriacus TaxID=106335 RepID=A0A6A3CD49_HIBSY|nr:Detected protein of unknown function [Hibiscus syriacus]
MRTKRKRACRKLPARKPAALAKNEKAVNQVEKTANQSEEVFLNFINHNRQEEAVSADSNDLEVVNLDPAGAKSNSSSSSSSSDSDKSFGAEESSSDDSSVERRSRNSTKGHGNAKQKASKLLKKGRKDGDKLPRVLRSSSKKQDESTLPQQDSRYNMKELKASLEVIKKIMKMDEAQPFNVPADPVASRKPDYFSVIDTPMDFGTICCNLENSTKYMNAEDVFNDVQYIWENCCKSNKKGEYIVYLMKRVKKKFMKYWIAAGLSIEQSRKINDYAPKNSAHEPFHPVGGAVDGASHSQLGFNHHYLFFPPSGYSQPHQLPQPAPSTTRTQLPPGSYQLPQLSHHPQPSTSQPQFSQLQARTGNMFISVYFLLDGCYNVLEYIFPFCLFKARTNLISTSKHAIEKGLCCRFGFAAMGYSNFQPPGDVAPKHKKHASKKQKKNSAMGPAASILSEPPDQLQQHHLSYWPPYEQSINQLQFSQLQAAVDGGHSHLLPQADYTRSRGYVPCYPVDPMVLPGRSHPLQSPLSHGESSEPQQRKPKATHCQPQSSQLQDNVDFEHSHMSLTDSTVRGIRCALKYSAGPTTNKSNRVNQKQLGHAKSQPEQTPQSLEQQPFTKKRKGRGPTRCRFLDDLAEGEQIFVQINKLGQPVGPNAYKLSCFLGTIARNGHRAPLTFVHWRAMPDSYKVDMWDYTKFDIDPSGKSWVMQAIGTKWRDWKADLKATYYYSLKTDEERLKVCDPRVVPEQWSSLISYWNTDEAKKRCARNKAIRKKQTCGHSSGTKSYARICEEERNKRPDGKEPTRAELYILTHTRKDGQPVDETASKLISKIREQEAKKQNNSRCSDESNDTLCQVMGEEKGDCMETSGMGPNRTGIFGSRPSRAALVRMASEAKSSANEEVRKMTVKMEAMEEKYTLMENHMARMASNMEKFLQKIDASSNVLGSEQHFHEEEDPEEDDT